MLFMLVKYLDFKGTNKPFNNVAHGDRTMLVKQLPNHSFIKDLDDFIVQLVAAESVGCEHGLSHIEVAMLYEFRKLTPIPDDLGRLQIAHRTHEMRAPFSRTVRDFSSLPPGRCLKLQLVYGPNE